MLIRTKRTCREIYVEKTILLPCFLRNLNEKRFFNECCGLKIIQQAFIATNATSNSIFSVFPTNTVNRYWFPPRNTRRQCWWTMTTQELPTLGRVLTQTLSLTPLTPWSRTAPKYLAPYYLATQVSCHPSSVERCTRDRLALYLWEDMLGGGLGSWQRNTVMLVTSLLRHLRRPKRNVWSCEIDIERKMGAVIE